MSSSSKEGCSSLLVRLGGVICNKNMNLKQLIVLIFFFFGLAGKFTTNAQQPDTLYLDVQTAVTIAVNENPTIKIAEMEIEKKRYAKKSAFGSLFPQIDLIGQYQRAIKRQTVYFDEGFGMGGGEIDPTKYTPEELKIMKVVGKMFSPDPEASKKGIQMGRYNVYTAGLNVSMPLLVPSLWKNIQMSELDIELAMEQARSSKIEMINRVKKSYYSLLLAHDSYHVFQKSYKNDSIYLKNIEDKLKQGLVPEYDQITADVRLKSIIPNLLQAENMINIAELQLKMLMRIDNNIPIKVTGSLRNYETVMFERLIPADTSLMLNSDLKQFDIQAQKAKKAVELQKSQFLPTLTSTFNYVYNSQNNDFKFSEYRWDPYSTLGISLSIPLFHGGKRFHELGASKIQVEQLKLQREDLERSLKLGIKSNIDLIQKNIKQVNATKSSVAQAKKAYQIARKRYETGLGTIVDLNAASLGVTSAELQYRNAIYDYLAAKADLEKMMGYDY